VSQYCCYWYLTAKYWYLYCTETDVTVLLLLVLDGQVLVLVLHLCTQYTSKIFNVKVLTKAVRRQQTAEVVDQLSLAVRSRPSHERDC